MTEETRHAVVQRAVFAAFGTVRLDYRSPKRMDEAASIVADFVCAELARGPLVVDTRREEQTMGWGEKIAADLANAQARENKRLRAALEDIAEYCSGDDRTLGAIERLVTVRNAAERALRDG